MMRKLTTIVAVAGVVFVYEGARSNDGKGVTISVEELSQLSDVDVLLATKGATPKRTH